MAALTLHPSAILRLRDHDERENALAGLVDDLRFARRFGGQAETESGQLRVASIEAAAHLSRPC